TVHYRDELDQQLRDLTASVLAQDGSDQGVPASPEAKLESWRSARQPLLGRWKRMLGDMQAVSDVDCAVFSVAHSVLRELSRDAA
ncbi:MAG: hypothetical protein GWN58_00325, partial [Anaerolineae bacterium]|nr:hypothetical protein [Anaerolineae bacterium]